jgi:pimeloyl-ACP methyl ester carboxylesterase
MARILLIALLQLALTIGSAVSSLADETSAVSGEAGPIVVVHGAWGGAHHWKSVADSLQHDHGRSVRRVSLTGLGERSHLASKQIDLTTHIQDVVNAIEFDDLKSVILIAHSYGGAVASGVVDAIPDRVAQVIYIDAHLLKHGECYLTHHEEKRVSLIKRANEAGDGWLIPVDWKNTVRDTPHPLATLTQPIELKGPDPKHVEFSYWLLADGKPAEQDERYLYFQRAEKRGWSTRVFPWNHNPQRQRPSDLVAAIVEALR